MTPRRRRRITLVLLAVAVIVVIAWLSVILPPAARQREAVERIRALGGVVTYDHHLPPEWRQAASLYDLGTKLSGIIDRRDLPDPDHDGRGWFRSIAGADLFHDVICVNLAYSEDVAGERLEPVAAYHEDLAFLSSFRELRQLLLHGDQACDLTLDHARRLEHLECIYMWNAKVTDQGMMLLSDLKNLRYLHLSEAGIRDAGLACLSDLTRLEGLSLQGNSFTDAGLVHLGRLTKLRSLWLCPLENGQSRITGEGLKHVTALTGLEELGLQGAGFSDRGLEHLVSFRNLKRLYIGENELTAEGLRRLGEILPVGCSVHKTPSGS